LIKRGRREEREGRKTNERACRRPVVSGGPSVAPELQFGAGSADEKTKSVVLVHEESAQTSLGALVDNP
jgi:hypothetical protein